MTIAPTQNHKGKGMWFSLFSWMSYETAVRVSAVANFLFVVSLLVGVAATIALIGTTSVKEWYWERDRLNASMRADRLVEVTARTNESAAKANEEAAKANERAAKAELELAKYRAPRSLTPDQYQRLVSGLRTAPKGRVIVKPNFVDREATSFAEEITKAFTEAGFEGVGDAPLSVISVSRPGLVLVIKDKENPPPSTQPILRAFLGADVSITARREDWAPDDTVVIMVSTKP